MNKKMKSKLYAQYLCGIITEAQFHEELGAPSQELQIRFNAAIKKFQGFIQMHEEELIDVLSAANAQVQNIFKKLVDYNCQCIRNTLKELQKFVQDYKQLDKRI
jgi:hypothetical protein